MFTKQAFTLVLWISLKHLILFGDQASLYKLQKCNITGKVYKIIQSMFQNSSMQIKLPDGLLPKIGTFRGVRQGCSLSPTLFNLFLSDLPDYIFYHIAMWNYNYINYAAFFMLMILSWSLRVSRGSLTSCCSPRLL
jgi:hypothetical protein